MNFSIDKKHLKIGFNDVTITDPSGNEVCQYFCILTEDGEYFCTNSDGSLQKDSDWTIGYVKFFLGVWDIELNDEQIEFIEAARDLSSKYKTIPTKSALLNSKDGLINSHPKFSRIPEFCNEFFNYYLDFLFETVAAGN